MKLAAAGSDALDPLDAVDAAYRQATEELGSRPDFLWCSSSAAYPIDALRAAWAAVAPGVRIHGTTSCQGAMTHRGVHGGVGAGLGVLALSDPAGAYGVAVVPQESAPRAAARRAVRASLQDAGRDGELPAIVWLSAAPGHEEQLLLGIADELGSEVPVVGGSAADDAVAGGWSSFTHRTSARDGVVVTTLFPSAGVLHAFHSGYDATPRRGRVTRVDGRVLSEIDGRPAARVYDEWTAGTIGQEVEARDGSVLAATTLHPIGRQVGEVAGAPYYVLSHPARVTADQGLALFTQVDEGDLIVSMNGSVRSLERRAGLVAQAALATHALEANDVAGGLVIYCAGCRLAVGDRMPAVVEALNRALPGKPFLGTFTFGEQGCFPRGENRHGNLMISVLLFEG